MDDQKSRASQVFSEGYSYLVTQKTTKGFTIMLNKPAQEDITFSWIALGVDKPKLSVSDGLASDTSPTPTPLMTTVTLTVSPTQEVSDSAKQKE